MSYWKERRKKKSQGEKKDDINQRLVFFQIKDGITTSLYSIVFYRFKQLEREFLASKKVQSLREANKQEWLEFLREHAELVDYFEEPLENLEKIPIEMMTEEELKSYRKLKKNEGRRSLDIRKRIDI